MDALDLALSCIPPALAVALQRWSIPTDKAMAKYGQDEQKRAHLPDSAASLIEKNLKGAVAVSGLAATFVSFPSGVFALFRSEPGGLIYIYILITAVIAIIVWISSVISARSPYELVEVKFRSFSQKPGKEYLPFTPIKAISLVVYLINGLLIILAVFLYVLGHFFSGHH